MEIDRRSFLSFVIGGAAGTALSPLPLKMTDDSAIWSQNWPWTPVPADGAASYTNSTCTLCPGGCGISVRKIDDRAVKIEGMKGHPVNDGGICLLGISGLQLLYGPTRVKRPLKRIGKRGEGKWQPVSWSQAISLVADNLKKLRSRNQPQSLGCILDSDRGTVPYLFARFMTAFGSPNFFRTPSIQDTYELTLYLMQGSQASAGFDFENANFILSFGSGLIEGWGSPVYMFKINSKWKKSKSKVVQIEPRLSNTAAKADKWIPINPGTEGALALGLAHVIVKKSLYSKDFINNHSFGFFDWTDDKGVSHKGFQSLVLERYSPGKVAEITGIDAATIDRLAVGFARASKPLAVCGRGQGDTPGSTGEFMAVHALNALVGNLNKPGGLWAVPEPDYINWPHLEMDQIAETGMQTERIDGGGSKNYPFTRYLLNRLIEKINSVNESPLQTLFVSGANPLYTLPDTQSVKKAFDKIPFVVSFSSYMDETAANADLILPNHTYLERYQDVPVTAGFNRPFIGFTQPVVSPQFDTRHVGDVIIRLAQQLNGNVGRAFPWDNYETCLKMTLGPIWGTLVDNGFWTDKNFRPPSWNRVFETNSSKFEFFATALINGGAKDETSLPHFQPAVTEEGKSSFPLVLVPYDTMRLANDAIGNPPFLTKTVADTILKGKDLFVEVNPVTAKSRGLSEGRYAILKTPKGSVKVKVHLFEGIKPGILAIPKGLGHTGDDPYLAGKGINYNEIIGPLKDPVSGLDVAWGTRADLVKA